MRIYHRGALLKVHGRYATDPNAYPAELSPYTGVRPSSAYRPSWARPWAIYAERLFEGPLPWQRDSASCRLARAHAPGLATGVPREASISFDQETTPQQPPGPPAAGPSPAPAPR